MNTFDTSRVSAVKLVWIPIRDAALHKVDKSCVNVAEIARDLWEFGAKSPEALDAVKKAVAESIPTGSLSRDELNRIHAQLDDLAERGYTESEYRRKLAKGARIDGIFAEVAELVQKLDAADAGYDRQALHEACARWWEEHEAEIRELCRGVAEQIAAGKWNVE